MCLLGVFVPALLVNESRAPWWRQYLEAQQAHLKAFRRTQGFMCKLLIFSLKTERIWIKKFLLFKSNVLRKFTPLFFQKTETAVYVLKIWEKYIFIWIQNWKWNINRRNNMPQPCKTSIYTPGPSNSPQGSTLEFVWFFKKQDQDLDTPRMLYGKLTLDGSY